MEIRRRIIQESQKQAILQNPFNGFFLLESSNLAAEEKVKFQGVDNEIMNGENQDGNNGYGSQNTQNIHRYEELLAPSFDRIYKKFYKNSLEEQLLAAEKSTDFQFEEDDELDKRYEYGQYRKTQQQRFSQSRYRNTQDSEDADRVIEDIPKSPSELENDEQQQYSSSSSSTPHNKTLLFQQQSRRPSPDPKKFLGYQSDPRGRGNFTQSNTPKRSTNKIVKQGNQQRGQKNPGFQELGDLQKHLEEFWRITDVFGGGKSMRERIWSGEKSSLSYISVEMDILRSVMQLKVVNQQRCEQWRYIVRNAKIKQLIVNVTSLELEKKQLMSEKSLHWLRSKILESLLLEHRSMVGSKVCLRKVIEEDTVRRAVLIENMQSLMLHLLNDTSELRKNHYASTQYQQLQRHKDLGKIITEIKQYTLSRQHALMQHANQTHRFINKLFRLQIQLFNSKYHQFKLILSEYDLKEIALFNQVRASSQDSNSLALLTNSLIKCVSFARLYQGKIPVLPSKIKRNEIPSDERDICRQQVHPCNIQRYKRNRFYKINDSAQETQQPKEMAEEYVQSNRIIYQGIKVFQGEYSLITLSKDILLKCWIFKLYFPKSSRIFVSHLRYSDLTDCSDEFLSKQFTNKTIFFMENPKMTPFNNYADFILRIGLKKSIQYKQIQRLTEKLITLQTIQKQSSSGSSSSPLPVKSCQGIARSNTQIQSSFDFKFNFEDIDDKFEPFREVFRENAAMNKLKLLKSRVDLMEKQKNRKKLLEEKQKQLNNLRSFRGSRISIIQHEESLWDMKKSAKKIRFSSPKNCQNNDGNDATNRFGNFAFLARKRESNISSLEDLHLRKKIALIGSTQGNNMTSKKQDEKSQNNILSIVDNILMSSQAKEQSKRSIRSTKKIKTVFQPSSLSVSTNTLKDNLITMNDSLNKEDVPRFYQQISRESSTIVKRSNLSQKRIQFQPSIEVIKGSRLRDVISRNFIKILVVIHLQQYLNSKRQSKQFESTRSIAKLTEITEELDQAFAKEGQGVSGEQCQRQTHILRYLEIRFWENLINTSYLSIDGAQMKVNFCLDNCRLEVQELMFNDFMLIESQGTHEFNTEICIDFSNILWSEALKQSRKRMVKSSKTGKFEQISFFFSTLDWISYPMTTHFNMYISNLHIGPNFIQRDIINLREILNVYIAEGYFKYQTNYINSKLTYADLRNLCNFAVHKMKTTNFLNLLKSQLSNHPEGTSQILSIEENIQHRAAPLKTLRAIEESSTVFPNRKSEVSSRESNQSIEESNEKEDFYQVFASLHPPTALILNTQYSPKHTQFKFTVLDPARRNHPTIRFKTLNFFQDLQFIEIFHTAQLYHQLIAKVTAVFKDQMLLYHQNSV